MVVGLAEIIIVCILALGGMMLVMALARSLGLGKRPAQPDGVRSEAPKGDFDSVRSRIERRYRRRFELAAHFVFYLFIVAGMALLRVPLMGVALVGGAWGLVLVIHVLQFIFAEFTDRAIEREIELEQARMYDADKPKRDWTVRLSDEGELIDVIEDEPETNDKQKRRG